MSAYDDYQLDDLIDDPDRMVRDTVHAFVSQRVMPIIVEHYRRGVFPRQLVGELASLGLLGATLHDHGGAGVSPMAYGLIMQELERGDSGLRSFCSVQSALVIFPIHAYGSDAQKAHWLPKLIGGEAIGCFGLTEADFGSNPAGMRTTARRDGEDYLLNGSKMWITNGSIADVAVVFARDDEGRCQGFLVEKDRPGFSTRELEGKLSLRASVTSELVFEDCRIPAENRLPGARGLKTALSCLDEARFGIAFGAIGAAQACLDEALDYAKERVQFDRPIAGYQLVQHKLVEMHSDITKARLLCWRLAQLKQQGKLASPAISLAKRNNVAMALRAARAARDILGANGILDEYSAMRHACNLEAVYTYEGTHDIHTLIIGRELTGLPAFSG